MSGNDFDDLSLTRWLSAGDEIDERLAERFRWVARIARAEVVEYLGRFVALDSTRQPIAAARSHDDLLLRTAAVAGGLRDESVTDTPPGWVAVLAWPQDVTFHRGDNMLRDTILAMSPIRRV